MQSGGRRAQGFSEFRADPDTGSQRRVPRGGGRREADGGEERSTLESLGAAAGTRESYAMQIDTGAGLEGRGRLPPSVRAGTGKGATVPRAESPLCCADEVGAKETPGTCKLPLPHPRPPEPRAVPGWVPPQPLLCSESPAGLASGPRRARAWAASCAFMEVRAAVAGNGCSCRPVFPQDLQELKVGEEGWATKRAG